MKGGMDYPPKKDSRNVDEDAKNAASGLMNIEKEGDESSGGSGESRPEEVPEISMEEVLSSFKTVEGEGESVGAEAKGKAGNPRRRRGEKKSNQSPDNSISEEPERAPLPESIEQPTIPSGDADTHKEARTALREAVLRFKDVTKSADSQIERSAMESKEQAYLAAYKNLEQRKSIWNRLSKGKELRAEEEKVEALKKDFNQSRIAYAAAIEKGIREPGVQNMSEAFVSRMTERYQKLVAAGTPPLDGFNREQSLREYLVRGEVGRRERISSYITFREVVRPLAEKKLQARVEALDARGHGAFTKGLAWVGAQNQKLDGMFGKAGARAVRAAASTLVVAGGAAALGSFGTAGLLAVAGWGTVKFARSFAGALIGAAAGEAGAFAYEKLRGRSEQEKARVGVLHEGKEMGVGFYGVSSVTERSLNKLDEKRDTLASRADEVTLQKKKALVKALVAMGVGAGAAAMLAEYTSIQQAADSAVEATSGKVPESAGAGAPASEEAVPARASSPENAPGAAAEVPYTIPTAPEGVASHEAVVGKGEGFNHLIANLRASGFTGFDSGLSTTELSEKLGALVTETGKNAVMLEGDKLLVDATGNVWFERDGETQLLMVNRDGVLTPHGQLKGIEMRTIGTTVVPVQESVAPAASPEAASPIVAETRPDIQAESPEVSPDSVAEHAATESLERVEPSSNELASEGLLPRANLGSESSVTEMPQNSLRTSPLSEFEAEYQEEDLSEPESNGEVFVNAHGVEIDDSVPSTYEWKVPGMDRTLTVSSGGSFEESSAFARSYANEHPGTTVHFITPVLSNGVVEYRLDAWDSVEGGPAQRLENIAIRESVGAPVQSYSAINPRDFIRKLL